jgi:hypothetical protein
MNADLLGEEDSRFLDGFYKRKPQRSAERHGDHGVFLIKAEK